MVDDHNTCMSALASQICDLISSFFSQENERLFVLSIVMEEIAVVAAQKGHMFIHGIGHEGLMLKALCMHFFHLGLSAHCVGDMTTPPISSTDLLIVSIGPGGFSTIDAIYDITKLNDARVLLLTAQPDSSSDVPYATTIAFLPAQTMADDRREDESKRSLLPMESLYEGAMFVLFKMVVFKLVEILGQAPDVVRSRHTNLE